MVNYVVLRKENNVDVYSSLKVGVDEQKVVFIFQRKMTYEERIHQ